MELSQDTREHLAYKWYWELLGRKPSKEERLAKAEEIRTRGLTWAHGAIAESDEAADFRKKRGW